MITTKQVREFNENFKKVLEQNESSISSLDWSVWFDLKHTQTLLDQITLRMMAAQFYMSECDCESSEFVQKFARFQGHYEALKDLSDILIDLQFSNKKEE
jgi:hypothetical protein|tara:strand:- start:561 stop:860 length:300 start_codon:yes stop_codon:yes gene_type:complete